MLIEIDLEVVFFLVFAVVNRLLFWDKILDICYYIQIKFSTVTLNMSVIQNQDPKLQQNSGG